MSRKIGRLVMGVAALACMVAVSSGALNAEDKKGPTNKEVMKAVAGKTGLCAKCGAAGKEMKWEDAQKLSKQLKDCAANLSKNPCPKGDAASWEKLSKKYGEQAAAIEEAAGKKDAKAFNDAMKAFTSSCKECHDSHKGK